MIKSYTWDEYFISIAYLVSMKSKDPSTRVGAVIVGLDKEIRATGYNGLSRGVQDLPERYFNKDYKFMACNHAEENAILNCTRIGISTLGCTLYVTWFPCSYCAKAIIQSGIAEVVYDENFPGHNNSTSWGKSMAIAAEILEEAGVVIRPFSGKIMEITGLYNSKKFKP
jgi:dCMP deaminase